MWNDESAGVKFASQNRKVAVFHQTTCEINRNIANPLINVTEI